MNRLLLCLLVTVSCKATIVSPNTGDDAKGDSMPSPGDGSGNLGELVSFDPAFAVLTITVSESANAERSLAPVSGGIPLARGVLQTSQIPRLTLAQADGYRVESFQEPLMLGSWADGSVKWLLLDFLATLPASGDASFSLGLADVDTNDDPAIVVTSDAQAFTVDTGVLKATLSKQQFSLFDAVWIDSDQNGVYGDGEKVVAAPGEMYIDLDDTPPGAADAGVYDYPAADFFGMEGGNWLRDSLAATSTRYLASSGDYSIELFREGRTHVVFKLEGWHENAGGRPFAKYSMYLHFWAQKSTVRASHTWIMTGDPDNNFVRRMAIELPMGGTGATLDYSCGGPFEIAGTPVYFNADQEPFVPVTVGPSQVHSGQVSRTGEVALVAIGPDKYYHNVPLTQDLAVDYEVILDGSVVANGEGAAGWVAVTGDGLGMAAGIRDFWREHPKEVQYNNGKLAVFLWPDHGGKALDLRRRYPEVRGTVAGGWGLAARREFQVPGSAVGIAKTTDLYFHFFAGDSAGVDTEIRGLQDSLLPFAGAEHNVASGVFGPLVAYDPVHYTKVENYLDMMMARIIRSMAEYHWYGWLDHGDYLPEFEKQEWELSIPWNPNLYSNWGYAGWLQENYRFGQWAFVQYFRSGRYRYFRAADTWLRHTRDVDCVYWETPDDGPHPSDNENDGPRLGGGHRHDQQHWGTYMTGYGIPTIALVHHYFLTGEGRDLDAMRDNADWILHAGRYFENYSEYSVLYMAEALDDADLMAEALAHDETPQSAYGRATFDSGMGLMLHDIHTNGAADVRAKLRLWADLDEATAAYLRAYLEAKEQTGTYSARIASDFDAAFPASAIQARRYEDWAPRLPTDFRDVFGSEIMPDGPWEWPIRLLESAQFDGPGGMGNDLGRHSNQMTLIWAMPHVGRDL